MIRTIVDLSYAVAEFVRVPQMRSNSYAFGDTLVELLVIHLKGRQKIAVVERSEHHRNAIHPDGAQSMKPIDKASA